MTKLMAISSWEEERIEDSEKCWRRSLLEFSKFSNRAAAKKVGLRLWNDRIEEEYRRRKYL